MCGYMERLHSANLADIELRDLLRKKLLDSLGDINSAMILGRVLYLLSKFDNVDDDFFVKITDHIYRNQLYTIGESPRLWCRYFKFIGDNRIYHGPLLEVLAKRYHEYLCRHMADGSDGYPRRLQESAAIAAWALAITASDLSLDDLFRSMLTFVLQPGVERHVLIRVYWSAAVSGRLLNGLDLTSISAAIDETLSNPDVGVRHKSHLHQLYTILRCLNASGITDDVLLNRCLASLHSMRYGYNDSKMSTSQRYVSDVLVRLGIPHKVELLTPDLLSIDIAIEGGGERIALEVDGPLHFTRVCHGTHLGQPMLTGPTRMKHNFLRSSGWHVISAPPVKLDDVDMMSSVSCVDSFYKRLLLNSGSRYLTKLLG
eukprot:XP_001611599.1 hypothetical protein [Babesia bovis T2Bo]